MFSQHQDAALSLPPCSHPRPCSHWRHCHEHCLQSASGRRRACRVSLQPVHLLCRPLSWIPAQLPSVRPCNPERLECRTAAYPYRFPASPSFRGGPAALGSAVFLPLQDPSRLTPPQTTALSAEGRELDCLRVGGVDDHKTGAGRGLCVLLRAGEGPGEPGGQQSATQCPAISKKPRELPVAKPHRSPSPPYPFLLKP